MGRDADMVRPGDTRTLAQLVQRAVFPEAQATPNFAAIAAKARALDWVATDAFRQLAKRIAHDAKAMANELTDRGYRLLTGGTDNHTVLVDLRGIGLSGVVAERALEECGIEFESSRGAKMRIQWKASAPPDWASLLRAWREAEG